jgi:hypothetical protein
MKARTVLAALLLGTAAAAWGQTLRVELERGPAYAFKRRVGLVRVAMTPHLAVWLESAEAGRGGAGFLKTVYVSLVGGEQDFWVGKRPHPLPVWQFRRGGEAIPDAVGSASPAPPAPAALVWRSRLPAGAAAAGFSVWLEANIGFDYNDAWPDGGKDLWGQPGLLYRADVPAGAVPGRYPFALVGRADGTGGGWTADLAGVTSAAALLASAAAVVE